MGLLLWGAVLVAAAWGAHWGAEQIVEPLKRVRKTWGLTGAGGAALVGIFTASPEIGVNLVSALRGVSEIGLGNMLGSNIISIPLMVTIGYLASRRSFRNQGGPNDRNGDRQTEDSAEHERHRRESLLALEPGTVQVLALPYLAILLLVAALTLPAAWRGLQPVDGWIMLAAYAVFLAQAVLRHRGESQKVSWSSRQIALAVTGVLALAAGAYFMVRATEHLVGILGIAPVVAGLFITGTVATAPEVFKTWSVVRSGQTTAGTISVIADNAVTMTVAFLPLALVSTPVKNFTLYAVNLAAVFVMPLAFALLAHFGAREHGFRRWQVVTYDLLYGAYVVVVILVIVGQF